MRESTALEKVRFYELLGIETEIAPGIDAKKIREALTESVMADKIRVFEDARALGAPARIFEAGYEAAAKYVVRASLRQSLGARIDPEEITLEVAASFRQEFLAQESPGEIANRETDITLLSEQIRDIERAAIKLVGFTIFDPDSMRDVKSKIADMLDQKAKLLVQLAQLAKDRAKDEQKEKIPAEAHSSGPRYSVIAEAQHLPFTA